MSEAHAGDAAQLTLDSYHNALLELFDKMSFVEKWTRVRDGLGMPPDSGEYKFARLQILRLSAPVAGVTTIVLTVLMLILVSIGGEQATRETEIRVEDPKPLERDLEKPPPPVLEQYQQQTVEVRPMEAVAPGSAEAPGLPGMSEPFSPQPRSVDTVSHVRSPLVFKHIYAGRDPGNRGRLTDDGGGGGWTEDAVMRALRWLKKNQNSDGSWPQTKPAMTGFALLAFLAHGETPASDEFGYTVEMAMRFLVSAQQANGHFAGWTTEPNGNDYSHPIATYALCEAYGMTGVPQVKEAASRAVECILAGQHASGGFNYKLNDLDRDDTSYMAWCAQALKAADIAYVMDQPERVKAAMRRAVGGFRKNYQAARSDDRGYAQGGFGYTAPGISGLTGAGALCMQLLGAADSREVKGAIETMKGWNFVWNKADLGGTIYYAYYSTQAKFHEGGEQWKVWNKQFAPALCESQTRIPKAIADTNNVMVDVGYWDSTASGHSDGGEGKRVMTTCLCTLMLEVYYRYLPTYKETAVQQDKAVQEIDVREVNGKKAFRINVGEI